MRDIKFRAWDKRNKEYFYNVGIHPSIIRWEGGYEHDEPGALTVSPMVDIYVIEQFTGLKDKTGKEIYEGDILTSPFVNFIDGPYNGIGSVIWLGQGFCFKPKSMNDGDAGPIAHNSEIIGNIHETPELLK